MIRNDGDLLGVPRGVSGGRVPEPMLINDKGPMHYRSFELPPASGCRTAGYDGVYSATKLHVPYVSNTAG
jgi:hypothetical protein